jgi:hypothetical protein
LYINDVTDAFTMESPMNTFTIRHIPPPVERSLRRIAKESHKSLNKTAIELLAKATGHGPEETKSKKKRDLKSVFRGWTAKEYNEFQRHIKPFEAIDEEMWRT